MASGGPAFTVHGRIVDPSLNRVTHGEHTVQVEPKIMQVLVALAERPSEVVSRDELMAKVWPGVFVTDDALHRAIRELRRLFDDDSERPAVIETIRKRGYRLIAPVDQMRPLGGSSNTAVAPSRVATPALVVIAALLSCVTAGALIVVGRSLGPRAVGSADAEMRFMPLTSDPGNEVTPALSASGRLAYVARGADGRAHIFTKVTPQSGAVQMTNGPDREYAPVWSPDERRIAFARISGPGCSIWIADADGNSARMLRPCGTRDELAMSWSPDGTSLALTTGAARLSSPSHIDIVDISSGVARPLTNPPAAHIGDTSPAFSPDGRHVAFVRRISGSIGDVFVTQVGSSENPRRITFDNTDILGVDWVPDGSHLIFSSDRGGSIGLWRVPAAGGAVTLVAGGGAKLKHPSVARRTGSIAYEDWHYEINLHETSTGDRPEGEESRAISPTSDRWNFHPQISPDGSRLAFQSTRSGLYELWISDRTGAGARQVTHSDGVYKSLPRWSPDGTRLAFVSRTADGAALQLVDIATGHTTTILSDNTILVAPSWSHDGARLYVGSPHAGSWQILAVDVKTGRAEPVAIERGYAAAESRDGQWLYYMRLDEPGLRRRPTSGGADEMVLPHFHVEDWPNWGVLDAGLFYLAWPDDDDPQLVLADADGGHPRPLTRLAEHAWSGVAVSRDGASVIYAHADRREANVGGITPGR